MMRSVVDRLRELSREQSGVVLILVALMLPIFMGMVGFGVDFGWLYWNGVKIQHGADAAALSGVIYEPDDQALAYSSALEAAAENGYNSLSAGTTVVPVDYSDDATAVNNPNQLRVTVTHAVPTFFMRVFGIDSIDITKTALAEYVLPLPLGSPDRRFGNDPATGHAPEFWGNIHGYYTGRSMGDRYSSQCLSGGSGSACTPNPDKRPTVWDGATPGTISSTTGGYIYGVEVGPGQTNLSVEIFDGPFTRGGGDFVLTGDQPQGTSPGPTTVFILYSPDPTPLDTTDSNEVLCTVVYAPRDAYMPGATAATTWADVDAVLPGGVASLWDEMCPATNLDRGPGVYPLRVITLDNGERGLNRWSLRASANGGNPRIYGLGSMAIYSNVDGAAGDTVFYLAEVDAVHAGKDLVISLWDPGDASGNHSLRIRNPQGGLPSCSWTSTNPSHPGGTLGSCDIPTSSSRFNNHLVTIRIDLPEDYVCGADCWWKIDYNYPGSTNDTTTWEARIEGNPVKLVE